MYIYIYIYINFKYYNFHNLTLCVMRNDENYTWGVEDFQLRF